MLSLEVGTMELGTLVSTAGAWSRYKRLRNSMDLIAFAVASLCISLCREYHWTAKVVQLATSVADENYRFAVKAR